MYNLNTNATKTPSIAKIRNNNNKNKNTTHSGSPSTKILLNRVPCLGCDRQGLSAHQGVVLVLSPHLGVVIIPFSLSPSYLRHIPSPSAVSSPSPSSLSPTHRHLSTKFERQVRSRRNNAFVWPFGRGSDGYILKWKIVKIRFLFLSVAEYDVSSDTILHHHNQSHSPWATPLIVWI